jgi:hypothetical protein
MPDGPDPNQDNDVVEELLPDLVENTYNQEDEDPERWDGLS